MSKAQKAAEFIKSAVPNIQPKFGIVLGSGLGRLTECISTPIVIPYSDIPGFPDISVAGQSGQLIFGHIEDVPVVCLKGRSHVYEYGNYEGITTTIRTLKLLGCEALLASNASGSLRESVGPGSLVIINDHINFQFGNPLVGHNDDEVGPRFPPMDTAYEPEYIQLFKECANNLGFPLHEGVYISVLGPNYETPAEIRAFRTLGADVIGMSTVPDVIIARHCGLKVSVIATITNYATGLTDKSHSHAAVCSAADAASQQLIDLMKLFIKRQN